MKRLLFTFKLLAILLVVDACIKCKGDPLPYYDFNALTIYYSVVGKIEVEPNENFGFLVDLGNLTYTASNQEAMGIISSAFAREKCPSDGYKGIKYAIDSIGITSSADWDISHPAGSSLDGLVYFKSRYVEAGKYVLLSEVNTFSIIKENGSSFQIRTSPTEDLKHVFHLTYYKTNGETVEGYTDTITWVP